MNEPTRVHPLISPELLNPSGAPVEAYLRPRTLRLFWQKVDQRSAGECWPWLAATNPGGYGVFCTSFRGWSYSTSAHRVSWIIANESRIPEGLELDHLCRTRSCVNPDHLEAVTHATNVRRGQRWID